MKNTDFLFIKYSSNSLFPPFKEFTLLVLPLDSPANKIELNDTHISDSLVSHYDCSKQHNQNAIEPPCSSEPTEIKHAICHLNGTDSPQLNAFVNITPSIFTNHAFFKLNKPSFRITRFKIFHYGALAWITNSQLVLRTILEEKHFCWDCYE